MVPSAPGGGWAAHIIAKRKDPEREEPHLKDKQVQPPSHFSESAPRGGQTDLGLRARSKEEAGLGVGICAEQSTEFPWQSP